MSRLVQLSTRRTDIPSHVLSRMLEVAARYAEKLGLRSERAEELSAEEMNQVLLEIILGNAKHKIYRDGDIYVVYAQDKEGNKVLIVYYTIWAIGWYWQGSEK